MQKVGDQLVQKHSGIIIKMARKYWWRLPLHVRSSYDIEDMVSELTVHLLHRAQHYDNARGSSTTFAWRVLENYSLVILKRETWAKRKTDGMYYLDDPMNGAFQFVLHDYERKLRESRLAVEVMIRFASCELRDALSDLLTSKRHNYRQYTETITLHDEVQKLAKQHRVSIDDFRVVMSGLV